MKTGDTFNLVCPKGQRVCELHDRMQECQLSSLKRPRTGGGGVGGAISSQFANALCKNAGAGMLDQMINYFASKFFATV